MSTLSTIREILANFQRASGVDPHVGHALVVDVAGANTILKEFFFGKLPAGVAVTQEPDELVQIDGIPVKLRYESPVYGHAFILPSTAVPARTCCDCASMATLTQQQCDSIAKRLKSRPRKRLGYRTPHQVFHQIF